jgi:methylated-DNA-[protein]-cysteine S-methyltransferase
VGEPVVTAGDTYVTASVDSPVGPLTLLASAAGLRAILWPNDVPGRSVAWPEAAIDDLRSRPLGPCARSARSSDHDHPVIAATRTQLAEYFTGTRRGFSLPLDLHGTPFQVTAWRALATIPYGTTTTYGEQARRLGDARWARAVGAANGRNPVSIVLPCHRLVGSTGALTGFAGGLPTKRALLAHERSVAACRGPHAFPGRPT